MSIFKSFFIGSTELLPDDQIIHFTGLNMEHAACKFGRWAQDTELLSREKMTPTRVLGQETEESWPFLIDLFWDGVYFTARTIGPVPLDEQPNV